MDVSAQVSRVENAAAGRTIETVALISRAGEPCVRLHSAFFVRDSFSSAELRVQALEERSLRVSVVDAAAQRLPSAISWAKTKSVMDYQVERGVYTPGYTDDAAPGYAVTSAGFIPPWAEWDFNEWESCTDTDYLLQQVTMVTWVTARLGARLSWCVRGKF